MLQGVVAGVRDYGNRMGIPTVNGAVFFDERYLGNPLVFCGTVGLIPVDKCDKHVQPGDLIFALGGRTGRDGIHGATFSSAELTQESESLSGGAVQIGNAVMEKMVLDVVLAARDRLIPRDHRLRRRRVQQARPARWEEESGRGSLAGTSAARHAGLSYTEIWISEAAGAEWSSRCRQNRKRNSASQRRGRRGSNRDRKTTDTQRLVLTFHGEQVGDLPMDFLHNGRPPVVRDAVCLPARSPLGRPRSKPVRRRFPQADLGGARMFASKEWIIRQYDHEVQRRAAW
ncbi:MAG: AIR synthase related protein [Planctomycetaceae bacterium]